MIGIPLLTGLTMSSSETNSPEVTTLVLSVASENYYNHNLSAEQIYLDRYGAESILIYARLLRRASPMSFPS
jgi:hypothetical protein